ncbi:2540_t:CDS:2, partial [Funneliformis geosporum]
ENSIHRDLHSGNILYFNYTNYWYIGDFEFCGPVDKPLGKVSSGRPPFAHFDHDYNLAMNLIKGMRPPIVLETPIEYKNIM